MANKKSQEIKIIKLRIPVRTLMKRMNNPKPMTILRIKKTIRIIRILCFITVNRLRLMNNRNQSLKRKKHTKMKKKINSKLIKSMTLSNQKMRLKTRWNKDLCKMSQITTILKIKYQTNCKCQILLMNEYYIKFTRVA